MSIELRIDEDLAVLTIARPQVLNALNFALIGELASALDNVAAAGVRALIITGAGEKAFCAGADIKIKSPFLTGDTIYIDGAQGISH